MSLTGGDESQEDPPKPEMAQRRPKRTLKVAGVVLIAVVAVGLVTAVVLMNRNDGDDRTSAGGPPISSTTLPPPSPKGQIDYSCMVMSNSSDDAINAINVYVDAFNVSGGEEAQLADAAVGALDRSANRVEGTFGPMLPAALRDLLKGYTVAARETSGVIVRRSAEDEFNTAIDQLNSKKDVAIDHCDALS